MILSEDVVQYIAENITSNVRQLEGVVKRLTAYRDILDDTITVDSVKRAIRDVIRTGTYIPTPDVIIEESARSFQLTGADLRGQSRSKKTAMARQIAMYLMRNLTNLPLKEIGEEFGRPQPRHRAQLHPQGRGAAQVRPRDRRHRARHYEQHQLGKTDFHIRLLF